MSADNSEAVTYRLSFALAIAFEQIAVDKFDDCEGVSGGPLRVGQACSSKR